MDTLAGRKVLVTGASSGIGEATARACAAQGATVACLARRTERVEAVAADIGGVAVTADVRDEESARAGVAEAVERLGGLDTLVNNAGVLRRAELSDGDVDDFRLMFDVNVLGLIVVTQAALPALRAAPHADIVNLGSMSGRRVPPGSGGAYSASKFAVHALSTALRREVAADGIRVTVIAPGFVRTEFGEDRDMPDAQRVATFAARRDELGLGPERVAETIVHAVGQPADVRMVEIALVSSEQEV